MKLVGKCVFVGNVAVNEEKGNIYMELVGVCVECGSYYREGKCIYGVSG
jgi:hypothetical protein